MPKMSKEELIRFYKLKIANASNKKAAVEEIICDLNTRVYADTNKLLTNQYKISILESLQRDSILKHVETFAQTDNDYLSLLQVTIERLGGK